MTKKSNSDRSKSKSGTTPDFFNKKAAGRPVPKRQKSTETYVRGILNGDRVTLGQAITLIESQHPGHQEKAQSIIEACLPHAGKSFRIGITGTPGVGKSSFIEALGMYLVKQEKKVAVLTIDPTSQKNHGSILGDKTRMQDLSVHPNAFIRPSPAGDSLGGVARKTRETMILCEAAGYEEIIVETVGVGQSETAVHSMVDFFLLLLLPGAGDELQGIKRGIVEMSDLIAINKADGDRITIARQSQKAYKNALHLLPATDSGWIPPVLTCSALETTGIQEIWQSCFDYRKMTAKNDFFQQKRRKQASYWLHERIQNDLRLHLLTDPTMKDALEKIEAAVLSYQKTPFQGAREIIQLLIKKH